MDTSWKKLTRVLVEVDPDLTDLIPDFLDRKRADLVTMQRALESGDFTTLAALGHKIKGEGGSFGFDTITEIGAAIEMTAKNTDRESARGLIGDLSNYLEKVEIVEGPEH
jgi:HPt (histidine-containing phosphotransfer) domain-containing protein